MYTQIVVALDGSDRALDALGPARRLCRLHGAELSFVTVALPGTTDETTAGLAAAARQAAGDSGATLAVLRADDAAAELARFTRDRPDALLCMTTRARGSLGRVVFGSVAAELIRRSDEAIVFVGPSCNVEDTSPIRRLLVVLDGSPAGETVLPWATRWSRTTGVPLALVRVVYPLIDPSARIPPTETQLDELAYVRRVAERLERDGHKVDGVSVQHSSTAEAIVDLAADVPGALVALAKRRGAASVINPVQGDIVAPVLRSSTVPVILAGAHATS